MAIRQEVSEKRLGETEVERIEYGGHIHAMETTYQGAVLLTREENYHDDSDFYALVWDETEQRIKRVDYATTRGWTYLNSAKVDATPEAREKAAQYNEIRQLEVWARENHWQSSLPLKGRKVRVVHGRKVAQGTEGQVFWYQPYQRDLWPAWKRAARVGLLLKDGSRVFVAADYVEVIDPRDHLQANETGEQAASKARDNCSAFSRCPLYV